jgi:hypothetical protein
MVNQCSANSGNLGSSLYSSSGPITISQGSRGYTGSPSTSGIFNQFVSNDIGTSNYARGINDDSSTDTMLALETLEKPLFPLYKVQLEDASKQQHQSADMERMLVGRVSENRLLNSELSSIFPKEALDLFQDVLELAKQFEIITQIVKGFDQLDDLEYRCVAVQYRLLSYDYKNLASAQSLEHGWELGIQGLCRITTLIFFGMYSRSS